MRSTPTEKTTRSPPERRRDRIAAQRLDARSGLAFAFFGMVFERTLRANFYAARMLGAPPAEFSARKLVLYANHPSWWDPIAYMAIARRLLPGRAVYAPIDAAMLAKYGFMRRIGAFGVEQGSARGAAEFLSVCRAAVAREAPLIVPAQGRFADVRERPLALRAGIAHLVDLDADICFLPLALEYAFWDEKRPEMLIAFGRPLYARDLADFGLNARRARLEEALTATLDRLSAAVIARDPARFTAWVEGQGGVNPVYDLWRRARAAARGKTFSPEHGTRR